MVSAEPSPLLPLPDSARAMVNRLARGADRHVTVTLSTHCERAVASFSRAQDGFRIVEKRTLLCTTFYFLPSREMTHDSGATLSMDHLKSQRTKVPLEPVLVFALQDETIMGVT